MPAPEDRLARLRDVEPSVASPGAGPARREAARRRARRRGAAAAGVAVVALGAGAGVLALLVQDDGTDSVVATQPSAATSPDVAAGPDASAEASVAPAPSPAPPTAPSPPPAPEPSVGGGGEASPRELVPPERVPDVAPEPPTSPVDSLLLRPRDLRAPAGASWAVDPTPFRPGDSSARLLDPCGGTAYPTDEQRTSVVRRDLQLVGPSGSPVPEGAHVRQLAARYPSDAVAREAFEGFRRVVEACGVSEPDPRTGTRDTTELVDPPSADGLLAQVRPEVGLATAYVVVRRDGDRLLLASLSPGETRDADALGREFADQVDARLGR